MEKEEQAGRSQYNDCLCGGYHRTHNIAVYKIQVKKAPRLPPNHLAITTTLAPAKDSPLTFDESYTLILAKNGCLTFDKSYHARVSFQIMYASIRMVFHLL